MDDRSLQRVVGLREHFEAIREVGGLLKEHLPTTIALSLVVFVGTRRQVLNVVFQGIGIEEYAICRAEGGFVECLQAPGVLDSVGFAALVVLLLFGLASSSVLVVPRRTRAAVARSRYRWMVAVLERVSRELRRLPLLHIASEVPARLAEADLPVARRRGLEFGIVATSVLLPGVAVLSGVGLEPVFLLSVVLLLFAAWVRWARNKPNDAARPGRLPIHVEATGRYLFFVAVSLGVGESLWMVAEHGLVTHRWYTVWAMLFLFYVIVATARLSEVWPVGIVNPRIVVSAMAVGYLAFSSGARIPTESAALIEADPTVTWLERLGDRLETMPDGPVILVAASGGGSRAALFASLVLGELSRREPPGRQEPYAANIGLISAVSGGSLATAYYVAHAQDDGRISPSNRHLAPNFTPDGVRPQLLARLRRYLKARENCHRLEKALLAGQAASLPGDCLPGILVTAEGLATADHARIVGDVAVYEAVRRSSEAWASANEVPWFFESAYVDAMATDFMAPLLRGVLTPFLERGESVARFWHDHLLGIDLRQQHAAAPRWHAPLSLYNVTDVDRGRRVVVGFPRVSTDLVGEAIEPIGRNGDGCDVRLENAVRLSANFPWGFEVAHLERMGTDGGVAHLLKLIDGGVVDNTGVDTLAAIIEGIDRLADSDRESVREPARRIRSELLQRSLMILEIDSGAKPPDEHPLESVSALGDPLKALSWAAQANAINVKRANLGRIQRAFEHMGRRAQSTPNERPPEHVVATCDQGDRIMTAWALGPHDKATVFAIHAIEAPRLLARLERAFVDSETAGEEQAVAVEVQGIARPSERSEVKRYAENLQAESQAAVENANRMEDDATRRRSDLYQQLQQGIPQPAPAGPVHKRALLPDEAWVYIGYYRDGTWRTTYFEHSDGLPPPSALPGRELSARGWSNLRRTEPDGDGEFGPLIGSLDGGDRVVIGQEIHDWRGLGYIWARARVRRRAVAD